MPLFLREVVAAAVAGWVLMTVPLSLLIAASAGSLLGCLFVAAWAAGIALVWAAPTTGVNFLLRSRPLWTRTVAAFAVAVAMVAVPIARAASSYEEWKGSGPGGMAFLAAAAFPVGVALVFVTAQGILRVVPAQTPRGRTA